MGPRNLCLWASDSICFILPFEKKQNTKTQPPSPMSPKNPKPDELGEGKPCLPLVWVKNCEVIWRTRNEANVSCYFLDLWVHALSLSWLCLRCKMHARRPVLFTKQISMSRKAWVCGPGRAGKGSCSSQWCRVAGLGVCDHCEPHRANAWVAINSRSTSETELEAGGSKGRQGNRKIYVLLPLII